MTPIPAAPRTSDRARGVIWAVVVLGALGLLGVLGARGIQRGRESTLDSARAAAAGAVELAEQVAGKKILVLRTGARQVRIYAVVPQPLTTPELAGRYERALTMGPDETEAELAAMQQEYPDAVTPAGVPLGALVAWMRFARAKGEAITEAETLGRAVVDKFPSVLSSKLLEQAASTLQARGVSTTPLATWAAQWAEDERLRDALHAARKAVGAQQWVTTADGQRWWLERESEDAWRAVSAEVLRSIAADARSAAARMLPAAAVLSVNWEGEELLESPENGERLAAREAGPLLVTAVLVDPEGLFREQRRQAIWLAALLGLALLAILGGFVAMQRALGSERQLNQQKSDFVASVSHELRAPVSSMRLMLENLQSGAVTRENARADYLRLLESECRRLSALIENVLDFARIEHGRKVYEMAETDVAAMIRDVLELLQPRAAQREQRLIMDVEPIEPAPMVDGLALQQALINLVDNAMKFSPPGTTITIRAGRRSDTTWEMAVRDEGPGIPAGERARIFDRFYRLGNELRRETQGAGIGLAIVKHTVEAHGGKIEVECDEKAERRGTTFRVILPARAEQHEPKPCSAS